MARRFADRITSFFRAHDADRSVAIAGPRGESRSDTSTLGKPAEWMIGALAGGPTASGASVGPGCATSLSAAYACVDLRSRILASLPVKLYRKEARGRVEVTEHPAARLLRTRPNGAQTPFSFLAHQQKSIDTRGNAVARVIRDQYNDPVALVPVRPVEIDPILTGTGDVVYRHQGRILTRADLLHIPGNDLRDDGIWGVSPVTRLRETFGLALATENHAATLMGNYAIPPIFLENANPAGKISPEQVENLRQQWSERYGGPNRGKPAFGSFKPHVLSFNAQDTQLLESRAFDVDQITRIYGVPGELIGAKGASSWGTGIGEKIQGFVKFTIGTLCVNWEQSLDLTLLTEAERAAGYYHAFSLDALLRGDLQARAAIYKTFREIAAIDVNQIRRLEDWEEYPDAWAGDPRQPLNNQGGGQATVPADPSPASSPDPSMP